MCTFTFWFSSAMSCTEQFPLFVHYSSVCCLCLYVYAGLCVLLVKYEQVTWLSVKLIKKYKIVIECVSITFEFLETSYFKIRITATQFQQPEEWFRTLAWYELILLIIQSNVSLISFIFLVIVHIQFTCAVKLFNKPFFLWHTVTFQ